MTSTRLFLSRSATSFSRSLVTSQISFQRRNLNSIQTFTADNQNDNKSNFYSFTNLGLGASICLGAAAIKVADEQDKIKREGEVCVDKECLHTSEDSGISRKDQQTINYQNRIRRFSTPDKVFRLFATIKVIPPEDSKRKGTVFMTPDDFVRSITPGSMQPAELDLDSYNKIQEDTLKAFLKKLQKSSSESRSDAAKKSKNVFDDITKEGLISFSDYIFLLTVLSTSARHWKILFKVFDQNGDGDVDIDEFMTVMKLAQSSSATGEKHRDTGDNKVKTNKKSAIINYFFHSADTTLTLEEFETFYNKLRHDILRVQFDKECPDKDDKINLMSVCKMLLAYIERIDVSSGQQLARCKAVLNELGHKPLKRSQGVTFEQVKMLFEFLSCIEDIEMALDMHTSANVELNKKEFRHVAFVVSNYNLPEKLVDAVYAVFDEDQSGGLSHQEFLKTIKSRASFGLDRPKDTGLWRFANSLVQCGKESVKNLFK